MIDSVVQYIILIIENSFDSPKQQRYKQLNKDARIIPTTQSLLEPKIPKVPLLQHSSLAIKLTQHPQKPDQLLHQYTSLYIECHNKSDQYFTNLCQNRFLSLLFQNSTNIQQPTCILQCLNLLITNTKYSQELVYILSQNILHQYLFNPNILKCQGQFIEYYVQLIKTILLKISQGEDNKSLIRMFCNNKYPTFPLLSFVSILANDSNQLIKVTAQQCILILVGLINQKKVYEMYLSEPPMIVFIARLATQFLRIQSDHEGICKYLADLLFQLRSNRLPLYLFSNILCNVIIVSSMPNKTAVALSFVQQFTKSVQTRVLEHKGLNKQQKQTYFQKKNIKQPRLSQIFGQSSCDNLVLICATFYRVLIKYMTNKYLNSSYLSCLIQLCPSLLSSSSQSNSLPLKVTYPGSFPLYKTLQEVSHKKFISEEHPSSQIELGYDFMDEIQHLMNQYATSKEFIKSKEVYLKKIGGGSNSSIKNSNSGLSFFGRIFNRGTSQQLNTQYMKYVGDFCSLNLTKGQAVDYNLARLFNPATCPFFSQFILLSTLLKKGIKYDNIKTGQQSDTVQSNQMHFNDIRSLWSLCSSNLDIILHMSNRFVQFLNNETNQSYTLVIPKLYIPPCYLFLGQLKDYLTVSLQQHINREQKNRELRESNIMLKMLSKVCFLLNVQLSETSYVELKREITIMHQELQNCLFQNGFTDVVQYLRNYYRINGNSQGEEIKVKSKSDIGYASPMQLSKKYSQQGKQKKTNIKMKTKPSTTYTRISNFESLQKILDPHMKPLYKHFEVKWKQSFSQKPIFFQQNFEQSLSNFKVSYFGKNGCDLIFVKLLSPPTFVLRVQVTGKKLLQVDIMQLDGIKKNNIDSRVLQFGGGNVQNVKTEAVQIGDQIVQQFKKCKFQFLECVTNATLQYLSSTNETLSIKEKSIIRQSSWRTSASFDTPN